MGFRITDYAGFLFPAILLVYYLGQNRQGKSKLNIFFSIVIVWVAVSSVMKIVIWDYPLFAVLKEFFRFFNGYMVFLVFPIVFRSFSDVLKLLNAFLFSGYFVVAQALLQIFGGPEILNLNTMETESFGDSAQFTGLYRDFAIYATWSWIGAACIIPKMAYSRYRKKSVNLDLMVFFAFIIVGLTTLGRIWLASILLVLLGFFSSFLSKKNLGYLFMIFIGAYFLVTSSFFERQMTGFQLRSKSEIEVLKGERDTKYAFHGRAGRWQTVMDEFIKDYTFGERVIGTDLYIGPHGDYFHWLFQYGYIGLILYLLLLFLLLKNVYWARGKIKTGVLRAYGTMALIAILVWMVTAIATNPTFMPDYNYFIFGNGAIFLSLAKTFKQKLM